MGRKEGVIIYNTLTLSCIVVAGSDCTHGPNADQDCATSHGEAFWAFVDAYLAGRIIWPADEECFDIDNNYDDVGREF